MSKQGKFKWWFESVSRILRNRQHEVKILKLSEQACGTVEKATMRSDHLRLSKISPFPPPDSANLLTTPPHPPHTTHTLHTPAPRTPLTQPLYLPSVPAHTRTRTN